MKEDSDKSATFSSTLQQCPDLLGICIHSTLLSTFGTHFPPQERRYDIFEYIILYRSLIHQSFLPSLSLRVAYISQFKLRDCQFTNEKTGLIREINMPHTMFHNITYKYFTHEDMEKDKAYLRFLKTMDNTTSWYLVQGHSARVCTEGDYENSLQSKIDISLFIHCKDIFKIRIILHGINVIFRALTF